MKYINHVRLRGRIGNDPLVRVTDSRPWAKASLYTKARWTGSDGKPKDASERHTLVFRGGWAEMARDELRKGIIVQVEGYLTTREYEDPNTRLKQHATEVVVTDIVVIQPSSRARGKPQGAPTAQAANADAAGVNTAAEQGKEDDTPF